MRAAGRWFGTRTAALAVVAGRLTRGPRRVSAAGIGSLACFTAAGLTVSVTVALVVAGVSLALIDWKAEAGRG